MIVIDTNVLMYAAGVPHPHKQPSADLLSRVAAGSVDAVIDAEALQEVLHRYRALGQWQQGRRVYDLSRAIFPGVQPVTAEILDEGRQLLDRYDHLMARDALHAAVCIRLGADALCSYDTDFDSVTEVVRVEPGGPGA